MDFAPSAEQALLKDSVTRFLAAESGFETLAEARARPGGFRPEIWQGLAELGLLGLPFAEEDGGFGGGPEDLMVVMEALGAAQPPEPYLSTVILGGAILRAAPDAQRRDMAARIAEGEVRLALAWQEPGMRWGIEEIAARVEPAGDGFVLSARKAFVADLPAASHVVVAARLGRGLGLFLVPAADLNGRIRAYATPDGRRAGDFALEGHVLRPDALIVAPDEGAEVVSRALDAAAAALACEAVGAMQAALDLTVEYLKTRRQFGVAIGSFQALQHRAADMYVALEQARSMAMRAIMAQSSLPADEAACEIAAAMVQVIDSARFVGQQAVQLHGGIGMTEEYRLGTLFRRLTMVGRLFGDRDHFLDRLLSGPSLLERL